MTATSQNSRTSASRGVIIVLLVWVAALLTETIFGPALGAEARGTNVPGDRYLIIVETSSSMKRRAANAQNVVGNLLVSGLNGQLRPGDTIGFWTFNEDLNAGSVPLQRWTPQTRQRLASGVVEFLQRQRYEKPAQLEKVLAPMMRVVKDSDKITVLLVSDGENNVSGTPFDGEINEAYKLNNAEQRKLHMPFVTVLRARKGEFIGWKVSMPPWPVEFPGFPAEPKIVEPISQGKPKAPEPRPKPATSPVPSIIVTGKKPEPPASALTNAASAEVPKSEPSPAATIGTNIKPVAVFPSAPAKSEAVIVPDKPKTPPAPETSKRPESIVSTNVATSTQSVSPSPIASKPGDSAPATSAPVTAAKSEPTAGAPPSPPEGQTAIATPSDAVFSRTAILIAGVVLLLGALGLVYALMRRSRTPAQISLITRSMDRDKE